MFQRSNYQKLKWPFLGLMASFWLVTCLAVGTLSYRFVKNSLLGQAEHQSQERARALAALVEERLYSLIDKGQVLIEASRQNFRRFREQHNFLKDQLAGDQSIIALALYERSVGVSGLRAQSRWRDSFRLIRRRDDPARFVRPKFLKMNEDYPLNLDAALSGNFVSRVAFTEFKGKEVGVLRLAVRYGRYVLGIDAFLKDFSQAVLGITDHEGLVLDGRQRMLMQENKEFDHGERLIHLPLVQAALASERMTGTLFFREYPRSPLMVGAFHNIPSTDMTVITQISQKQVLAPLGRYVGWIAIAFGVAMAIFIPLVVLVLNDIFRGRRRREELRAKEEHPAPALEEAV